MLLLDLNTGNTISVITACLSIGVGMIQLYVSMRLAKMKDELKEVFRREVDAFKKEIDLTLEKTETKMVTHKDMEALGEKIKLLLSNMELKTTLERYKDKDKKNEDY